MRRCRSPLPFSSPHPLVRRFSSLVVPPLHRLFVHQLSLVDTHRHSLQPHTPTNEQTHSTRQPAVLPTFFERNQDAFLHHPHAHYGMLDRAHGRRAPRASAHPPPPRPQRGPGAPGGETRASRWSTGARDTESQPHRAMRRQLRLRMWRGLLLLEMGVLRDDERVLRCGW